MRDKIKEVKDLWLDGKKIGTIALTVGISILEVQEIISQNKGFIEEEKYEKNIR
jgi:hypothetical protein